MLDNNEIEKDVWDAGDTEDVGNIENTGNTREVGHAEYVRGAKDNEMVRGNDKVADRRDQNNGKISNNKVGDGRN